jgi:hypothetical protein
MRQYTQFVVFETWKLFWQQKRKLRAKRQAIREIAESKLSRSKVKMKRKSQRRISAASKQDETKTEAEAETETANGPQGVALLSLMGSCKPAERTEREPATVDESDEALVDKWMLATIQEAGMISARASTTTTSKEPLEAAPLRPTQPQSDQRRQRRQHHKQRKVTATLQQHVLQNPESSVTFSPQQTAPSVTTPAVTACTTGRYIVIENLGAASGVSTGDVSTDAGGREGREGGARRRRRGKEKDLRRQLRQRTKKPNGAGCSAGGEGALPPVDSATLRHYVRRKARARDVVLLSCYGPA